MDSIRDIIDVATAVPRRLVETARDNPGLAAAVAAGAAGATVSVLYDRYQAKNKKEQLSDQTVLITGGSRGIGAGIARAFASAGARRVIIVAREERTLNQTADDINASVGREVVVPIVADCGKAETVQELAKSVVVQYGAPDVLVLNAGTGPWVPLWETSYHGIQEAMASPLTGYAMVTRAFLPHMLSANAGTLMFVQSPASRMVFPGTTAYTAARWGVRGLIEALRQDLRTTAVKVCEVTFGAVASDFFKSDPTAFAAHAPGVSKFIPPLSCDRAGQQLLYAYLHGRDSHVAPLPVAAMMAAEASIPGVHGLMQALFNISGWTWDPQAKTGQPAMPGPVGPEAVGGQEVDRDVDRPLYDEAEAVYGAKASDIEGHAPADPRHKGTGRGHEGGVSRPAGQAPGVPPRYTSASGSNSTSGTNGQGAASTSSKVSPGRSYAQAASSKGETTDKAKPTQGQGQGQGQAKASRLYPRLSGDEPSYDPSARDQASAGEVQQSRHDLGGLQGLGAEGTGASLGRSASPDTVAQGKPGQATSERKGQSQAQRNTQGQGQGQFNDDDVIRV